MKWFGCFRSRRKMIEGAAKERRLQQAEAEVAHLSTRADKVVGILSDRSRRNHWSDSINQIIQGKGV